jgi:chorismate synthase
MSHNTFGHLFRVTSFGESHGPAIGCVVDGCPPGIALTEADIQPWLDKRRPGQSKFVTQRKEPDTVKILSGVFQDERMKQQLTTGAPIAMASTSATAAPGSGCRSDLFNTTTGWAPLSQARAR